MNPRRLSTRILVLIALLASAAHGAQLRLNRYFTDNMVLQRDKPIQIKGFAPSGAEVTVRFAGQTKKGTARKDGTWSVALAPMPASATGQELTVVAGGNTVSVSNVLVGDVWMFGRQSTIDVSLGRDAEGKAAAAAYKPTGNFRAIVIRTEAAMQPQPDLDKQATTGWQPVTASTALDMSAAAFYLGNDLAGERGVPVGIVDVRMGPFFAIGWLSEKAIDDSATRHPDDKEIAWLPAHMREKAVARVSGQAQKELDDYHAARVEKARGKPVAKPSLGLHPLKNPMYPSGGYNAVIHPLQGITLKGILLQLGNDYPFIAYRELEKEGKSTVKVELDAAWGENYPILKNGYRVTPVTLPYVPADWRRSFGDEHLPIGLILPPSSDLDVYAAHNREIRELHRRTAEAEREIGLILPGMENIDMSGQPADEKLLAERARHWVLGAVSGKQGVTATGPVLDRVEARLMRATIYFKDGTAQGLRAIGNALDHFETAGPDREFRPAAARIDGSTIRLKGEGPIQFVRYNWSDTPDPGLVNSAGLPALPFSTDADWTFGWIPPPEKTDLPEEYKLTADKWSKSDIAIINGQIASMATGDSEPIPRRPGPLGIEASPFGPNIYVIRTAHGSPADGKLMPGDVIYGVNGTRFSDDPGAEGDQQYKDLADAITFSESDEGQGKLVLSVRRKTETLDVELELEVLGSYSSTTPYYCEKSENIVRNAETWLSQHFRPESGEASPRRGFLNTDMLFILASGKPEYQGLVRRAVYSMMAGTDPKPVTEGMASKPWNTGHESMLLGEYYHATGDRNVLPYLKYQCDLSAESQLKPPEDTHEGKEAAQTEEQVGGWRHNYPSNPERWKSGYGLLPHAGMGCVMGMQLAKEAGLDIDEVALERGLTHFHDGRAEYGFVLYSYANTRRTGPPPINPEAEAKGKLWSMNGKLGMAAALYDMVEDEDTVEICARHCVYGFNHTRGGHGGMFFNNFWTPIGAWAGGERAFKHFMKGQTWWRELFRRHDGAFNQVGRGGIGVSYGIPYVAPKQRLRMLGAPVSAFGTNCPDYLKPAVQAHWNRDYALCEKLILEQMERALPADDMPVIHHLLESVQILRASIDHDLALTEKYIEDGKYYYASLEVPQLTGVVAEANPRLKAIVELLDSPEGRAEVKEHRRQCQVQEMARKAGQGQTNSPKRREDWVTLVAQNRGNRPGDTWQMKLVEHISQAPEGWTQPDFDDRNWNPGSLPLSWCPYHTALFRTTFTVEDKDTFDLLRVAGQFFQQANVVIHLNGEVVAKIDNLGRGGGETDARLTSYAMELLKEGENTIALSSRHKRRWGPFRGKYKTAATVSFEVQARKAETTD